MYPNYGLYKGTRCLFCNIGYKENGPVVVKNAARGITLTISMMGNGRPFWSDSKDCTGAVDAP